MLTNAQFLRICKAFANSSPANIEFSETQFFKIIQLGRFLSILIPLLSIHSIMNSYPEELKDIDPKESVNKDPSYIFCK